MERTIITRVTLLGLQCCTVETDMAALTTEVNRLNPCGTTSGWVLDDRPKVAPVTCADHPDRKHVIFTC